MFFQFKQFWKQKNLEKEKKNSIDILSCGQTTMTSSSGCSKIVKQYWQEVF